MTKLNLSEFCRNLKFSKNCVGFSNWVKFEKSENFKVVGKLDCGTCMGLEFNGKVDCDGIIYNLCAIVESLCR